MKNEASRLWMPRFGFKGVISKNPQLYSVC